VKIELFSIAEVADLVGISRSRIRRYAEDERLPTAIHGGAEWALTRRDIAALRRLAVGRSGRPAGARWGPARAEERERGAREDGRPGAIEILLAADVGEEVGVHGATVRRAAVNGELPTARRLGRQWFFTRRDVDRLRTMYE
jgi:predicted DNA-binding transcriptional regulator AlpA